MPDSSFLLATIVSKKHATLADKGNDRLKAQPGFQICKDERSVSSLCLGVVRHHFERCADHRRQIDFVDDQQIRFGDPRPALARYLFAGGNVDDIQREIREFGREGGSEVIAARFDEDQLYLGKGALQAVDGFQIDEASSRMAVCGQPPVSTPMMRSGSRAA